MVVSVLPQHQQALASVVSAIRERLEGRCQLMLVNSFAGRSSNTGSTGDVVELFEFPLGNLPAFKSHLIITAASGLRRADMPPSTKLVHFLHSLGSLDGLYPEDHFDDFDYIVCGGRHHVVAFQEWRKMRPQLAGKGLILGGYPKLDSAMAGAKANMGAVRMDTVVYAPTLTLDGNRRIASLQTHGSAIVAALLGAGARVIFRPHPYSCQTEDREFVNRLVAQFEGNDRFSVDNEADHRKSYETAALMVSDLSGTGFTYAFTYGRPVIFFAPDPQAEGGMRGIHFEARHQIGKVVRKVEELAGAIQELGRRAESVEREIEAFRALTMYNLGTSAHYCAQQVELLLQGQAPANVVRL